MVVGPGATACDAKFKGWKIVMNINAAYFVVRDLRAVQLGRTGFMRSSFPPEIMMWSGPA